MKNNNKQENLKQDKETPYVMSLGKLINELKGIEREIKNPEQKENLRFVIDCLSLGERAPEEICIKE